jgi:hypothetical protein
MRLVLIIIMTMSNVRGMSFFLSSIDLILEVSINMEEVDSVVGMTK